MRRATIDPRRSIQDRYGSLMDMSKLSRQRHGAIADNLMLEEDVDRVTKAATDWVGRFTMRL